MRKSRSTRERWGGQGWGWVLSPKGLTQIRDFEMLLFLLAKHRLRCFAKILAQVFTF